jgi:hypothetical protein
MRRLLSTFLASAVLATAAAPAAAQVIVPNSLASTEANSNNRFPFLVNGGMRWQQVYAASQFPTAITIGTIRFRPDNTVASAFTRNLSSVQLSLSTTSAAPDALSTTFANNLGADNTVVYSGALTLSSNFVAGPGNTMAFDITINLQTPFSYNPANGNLLMNLFNNSPENNDINVFFDAETTGGDSVSRLFSNEGDPTATVGTQDTSGMVTQFLAAAAVPEPATLAVLGMGAVGGMAYLRRKRKVLVKWSRSRK